MNLVQRLYKPGDWIVHVDYGVGQVLGEDQKTLGGEKCRFLRVKTSDSIYWIPIKNIDNIRIRPIASKNQFRYALILIQKAPKKLAKSYLARRREIAQTLKDVSLYSKVRLMRDLNARKSTNFNSFDSNVLVNIKEQFLLEWKLVMEEDQNKLELILKNALKTSIGKA